MYYSVCFCVFFQVLYVGSVLRDVKGTRVRVHVPHTSHSAGRQTLQGTWRENLQRRTLQNIHIHIFWKCKLRFFFTHRAHVFMGVFSLASFNEILVQLWCSFTQGPLGAKCSSIAVLVQSSAALPSLNIWLLFPCLLQAGGFFFFASTSRTDSIL